MKKYYSKDKIENYSTKELHKVCKFIFTYCKDNLGYNNRKRIPLKYILDRSKKYEPYFGWYESKKNLITIKMANTKTLKEFVATFIHEYVHSLQPCRTYYFKLLEEHGYDKHPYEIEARSYEFLFKKVLREFRKEFGHKK